METNMGLVTHLVSDYHVYWFASIGAAAVPGYVLMIDTHTDHPKTGVADYAQTQHPGHHYRQIYNAGGYQLAQRTT